MKTILLIEDDKNISRGIEVSFEREGFSVLCAHTLKSGTEMLSQHNIDLIILDLNLPDGNGIEFCKTIREKSNIPIIMLTAFDLETDEVSGFAAGADDYVKKPFSLSVLRARVDAVLRRLETKICRVIVSGAFKLDVDRGKLFKCSDEISVTATELKLLSFFMGNAGQILSKEQILDALWDNQGNFVDENTLSVNISRVRAKIEDDPKSPKIIKTVHGMGYVWAKE